MSPRILPCLALLSGALVTAALAAQERGARRFMPGDAVLVAHCDGPARLRATFGETGLGKLVADAKLAAAVREAWSGVTEMFGEELQGERWEELLARLVEYGGRVTVGVRLTPSEPRPSLVLALAASPDGSKALEELASAVRVLLPESEASVTVAGAAMPVVDLGGLRLLGPSFLDGHLVAWLTTEDDDSLAGTLLGDASEAPLAEAVWRAPCGAIVMPGSLLRLALAPSVGARVPAERLRQIETLLHAAGASALQDFRITIVPEGQHVVWDAEVAFDPQQPLGLLSLVHSPSPRLPGLVRLVPTDHPFWTARCIGFDRLGPLVREIWGALGPAVPMTADAAYAKAAEVVKIDVEQEVLGRLGDEMLVLDNVADELADDVDFGSARHNLRAAQLYGSCYVLAVREGEALARAVDRVLRSRGLHAARKREDHHGTSVYRLTLLGSIVVEYAFTDRLALVALGPQAGKELRAVLDRSRALAELPPAEADAVATALEPALQAEIARLGAGVDAVGIVDLAKIAEQLVQQLAGLESAQAGAEDLSDDEAAALASALARMLSPVRELPAALSRAGLGKAYTLGCSRPGKIVFRQVL